MRIRLSIPLFTKEIALSTGASLHGDEKIITHLTTNSKEVEAGDMFIALQGQKFDGEEFVSEALARGGTVMSTKNDAAIQVSDTRDALLCLAAYYADRLPRLKHKIAITGSVGKTTTKEFLKLLVSQKHLVHANKGNCNNEIGMPLTVLSAPEDCEVLICEMGMNHKGEISRMSKALRPTAAIITNIGRAHIGNLGSKEAIAEAKMEILDGMSNEAVVVPYREELLNKIKHKITFSIESRSADFLITDAPESQVAIYKRGAEILTTKFDIFEQHIRNCLIAGIAISDYIGLSGDDINRGVLQISRDNLRQNTLYIQNRYFYTDYYNASPESIYAALQSVLETQGYEEKSLILGDILELGASEKSICEEIGARLAHSGICNLYLFGRMAKSIKSAAHSGGFPLERIFINSDLSRPEITVSQVIKNSRPGALILMKASRGVALERVIECLNEDNTR